jgi:DNA-binding transcriptional ArsR family regulator
MPRRNGIGIALLADETRRRIVALLAIQPRRPSTIAEVLRHSRPAVTRQLKLLEREGLVWAFRSRIDGRGVVYRINPAAHGRIIAWLAGTDVGVLDHAPPVDATLPADGQ